MCQRPPRQPAVAVQARRMAEALNAVVETHCSTPACGSLTWSLPHVLSRPSPSRGQLLNLLPPCPFRGPGVLRHPGYPALLERRKRVRRETLGPGPLWTPIGHALDHQGLHKLARPAESRPAHFDQRSLPLGLVVLGVHILPAAVVFFFFSPYS